MKHGLRSRRMARKFMESSSGIISAVDPSPGCDAAEQLSSLLNNVPGAVYRGLRDWSLQFLGAEVERLTGYPPEVFLRREGNWKQGVDPEDLPRVVERFRSAAGTMEKNLRVRYRIRRRDGSERWLEDRRQMIYDEDGHFSRVDGLLLDITEEKATEDNLRRTVSLLNATLESTADGILVVDAAGKIAISNRRFLELWRIPEEVMASKEHEHAISFVLGQLKYPEAFLEKVRKLYAAPEEESSDMLEFKDGRVFERYSLPMRSPEGVIGRGWGVPGGAGGRGGAGEGRGPYHRKGGPPGGLPRPPLPVDRPILHARSIRAAPEPATGTPGHSEDRPEPAGGGGDPRGGGGHGAQAERGGASEEPRDAAAIAEDGSGGTAGRRRRPRLQQPPVGDRRLFGPAAAGAGSPFGIPGRRRGEPGGERARCDARRRQAPDRDGKREDRRTLGQAAGLWGARRICGPLGEGHRKRDGRGYAVPRLRAVLLDEGTREGDRARSRDGLRHRQAERWGAHPPCRGRGNGAPFSANGAVRGRL